MTGRSTILAVALAAPLAAPGVNVANVASAQAGPPIVVHVAETAGIRRTAYPVNARVPFPRGTLADAGHVRLLLNGADAPAQFQAESRWPDGSVQWLDVDFNASIGPLEKLDYAIEYGPAVAAQAPPRGLAVADGAETIQVGNVTFGKNASPLIRSVKYREEDIGHGANGISIVDAAGTTHDFVMDGTGAVKVVKPGPLYVMLAYAGQIAIDPAYRVPVALTVEMPNSKTWVKVSATLQDPARRVRAIAFHTPLALAGFPWLWDFGTTKGTYGVFRSATDQATLTQTRKNGGPTDWRVELAAGGRPAQVSEVAASEAASARWGHIQDGKEVIAFALDATYIGTTTMDIDGAGQLGFRVAPENPSIEDQLTVYEHFVTSPVQIGAATSPAAMLAPLVAVCDLQQYATSQVAAPK